MQINVFYEMAHRRVVLEILDGGYTGKFFFDEDYQYLGAIEIYNPPWGE